MTEPLDASPNPTPLNSDDALQERLRNGLIAWPRPALLLLARSFLLPLSQAIWLLVLTLSGNAATWRSAGDWWPVYGTLVDVGCLVGMRHFLRKEGIRLRDLLGPVRLYKGRDLWLGLGLWLGIFPFFFGGAMGARWLVLRFFAFDPNPYLVSSHRLPAWALVYGLAVWWVIWSPTEEATYQAYVLPRLRVLTGRNWLAFLLTAFWWAAQHGALPLVADWRFLLFRTLAFLPGVVLLQIAYLRIRRLMPLVIAHWPMDIAGMIFATVVFAPK